MYGLCLETSADVCSVALFQETRCLAAVEAHAPHSHARVLPMLCDNALKIAECNRQDLSAVAISKGPGSFTGLRIGVATAKGMAYALNKPLIAVDTLYAFAACLKSLCPPDYWLCPVSAMKGQSICYALYDPHLKARISPRVQVCHADCLLEYAEHPIAFFGSGAETLSKTIHKAKRPLLLPNQMPKATYMGELAYEAYTKKRFEDPKTFVPNYAKEFKIGQPKKKN